MENKHFLEGKRGVAKSSTGSYMSYTSGNKKEGTEDTVRHGFSSKQEARAHGKHNAKSKALAKAKGEHKKTHPNNLFESADRTMKRIKNETHVDSRYDDVID